jgi:phosphatidylinositol-4-phosphate 3-kinase
MYGIAGNVKASKESLRLKVLTRDLEQLHHSLEESPTCLPLSPSLEVHGVQVRTCSYFPSFTLPLKINFLSTETGIIPAIFKVCKYDQPVIIKMTIY